MSPLNGNPNTLWASLLVESFASQGVAHVVIGAGSRSTPLTLAFAAHPDVAAHSFIDERSGGFFALGLAKASGQPVALVSTSGTAGANFFPAVIEANATGVPLIVLTADRPPELRESGANQTIDQIKLFGDQVRWFHEVALPEHNPSAELLNYLRTLGARAVIAATGGRPGPVHLNLPFRPPLEPAETIDLHASFDYPRPTRVTPAAPSAPSPQQLREITDLVEAHPHGLIVCGPDALSDGSDLLAFEHHAGYPVLADGTQVGQVTSGALSPTTGKTIALARVRAAVAKVGTPLQVEVRGKPVDAVVVKRPFYKNPAVRA